LPFSYSFCVASFLNNEASVEILRGKFIFFVNALLNGYSHQQSPSSGTSLRPLRSEGEDELIRLREGGLRFGKLDM